MITNLPNKFPLNKLDEFSFGSVEAENDDLLESPFCICMMDSTYEYLEGKKSLIVGERGSGKSALFKLTNNNKINFKKNKDENIIIIPIEEELHYQSIKKQILSQIQAHLEDDILKHRIIWEIFIIYKILTKLKKDFFNCLPDNIKQRIQYFENLLDIEKKDSLSFKNILSAFKFTVGVKIDNMYGGNILLPNFYSSIEPSNNTPLSSDNKKNSLSIDFEVYKNEINSFLKENKHICYILFDKLDEFAIKEDYKIQKLILQSLLECERSYLNYKNIKLKIFLRKDLFDKLDYNKLGYDKISSRTIHLKWENTDIRKFLSRRITYNFFKIMNLNSLFFTIDEEKLLLDESSIDHFEGINHSKKPNSTSIKKIFKNLFNRSKTIKQYDSRDGRHINFTDEISRQIIISIFPRQIKHYTKEEILTDIDFLSFLETHFCLNTGYTTPRIIIMFVEKCLSLVKEYYRNNPDISVELENNEYPLIKRDLILKAYSDFKNELLVVFSKISHKWERWFNSLRTKRGNKYSFSYNDIRRLLQIQDKDLEEQTSFLAFLDHIGYIKCENPFSLPYKRKYKLPILFR